MVKIAGFSHSSYCPVAVLCVNTSMLAQPSPAPSDLDVAG